MTTRQQRHRTRQEQAGYQRIEVQLPAALVAAIDERRGAESRSEYIKSQLEIKK